METKATEAEERASRLAAASIKSRCSAQQTQNHSNVHGYYHITGPKPYKAWRVLSTQTSVPLLLSSKLLEHHHLKAANCSARLTLSPSNLACTLLLVMVLGLLIRICRLLWCAVQSES